MLNKYFFLGMLVFFLAVSFGVQAKKHVKMVDPATKIEKQHKKNLRNLSVWRKKRLKMCERVKNKDSCVAKTEEKYIQKKEHLTEQYLARKAALEQSSEKGTASEPQGQVPGAEQPVQAQPSTTEQPSDVVGGK